jgi:hypothetical protein
MKRLVPWLVVLLAFLGAGCAATPKEDLPAYERATPCCKVLSELRYQALRTGQVMAFDIDAGAPLFVFETGRSFVLPLELPVVETPYVVQLRSYVLGDRPEEGRVFYPVVLVLDADHRVLSRREVEGLAVASASYEEAAEENRWGLPLRLEFDVAIDDAAARYLVVHTSAHQLETVSEAATKTVVPIILPGFVTALPGGTVQVSIRHSPFGRVAVRIKR